MKRKFGLLVGLFMLAAMAACGKEEAVKVDETGVPLPLDVKLTVTEQVDVNGIIKMEAVVTQGDEKVDDADEVEFEVWEEGKKTKVSRLNRRMTKTVCTQQKLLLSMTVFSTFKCM